jgi:hypothetical protein
MINMKNTVKDVIVIMTARVLSLVRILNQNVMISLRSVMSVNVNRGL